VEFQYQIQTSISQTPQVLNGPSSPLKAIEIKISNVLAQSFFRDADCMAVSSTTSTTTSTSSSSELFQQQGGNEPSQTGPSTHQVVTINTTVPPYPILGLSAAPADEILPGLDGVKCRTQSERPEDRCYIIRGQVTTFWGNDSQPTTTLSLFSTTRNFQSDNSSATTKNLTWWATDAVKSVTKQAMDNGEFNTVHPDIHDIFFITKLPFDPNNATIFGGESPIVEPPGDEQPRDVDQDDNDEAWPWIMLSLGICCSLLLLLLVRKLARRHKCHSRMRNYGPTPDSGGSTLVLLSSSQPPMVLSSSSSITTTTTPSPTKSGTTTSAAAALGAGATAASASQISTQRAAKLDPVPENEDPTVTQPPKTSDAPPPSLANVSTSDENEASGHSLT
jgi:hypothetical protein